MTDFESSQALSDTGPNASNTVLEDAFVVSASPAEVYRILVEVRRTHDWAVLPGCTVVEPAVVTSRTSSGAITGQLVKANTAQGQYVACHFRANLMVENEFVRTTVHLSILSEDIAGATTLSASAMRDRCVKHYSMKYVSDWDIEALDQSVLGTKATLVTRTVWALEAKGELQSTAREPLALSISRENKRFANIWFASFLDSIDDDRPSVSMLRAADLAAGALVRASFTAANVLVKTTTSSEGLTETTKAIVDGVGNVGALVYLPHERGLRGRETGVVSPPNLRAADAAKRTPGDVTEAVLRRRAKVRAHFEVDGSISPLVGSVEKGQTVTVVDSASAKDGTPRSKIEAPGIVGWVTSDLLERANTTTNSPDAVFGDSPGYAPLREPSALRRSVSLQRPRIHVAI